MKHETIQTPDRGARPVAYLGDLPVIEANFISYFRRFMDSSDSQTFLHEELVENLGDRNGQAVFDLLSHLLELLVHHSRRPIARHDVTCVCVGGDESALAQCVASAADGAREEALMFSMLFVRHDIAPIFAASCEQLGLQLKRATPRHVLHKMKPQSHVYH